MQNCLYLTALEYSPSIFKMHSSPAILYAERHHVSSARMSDGS
jgi:hypothetical protein